MTNGRKKLTIALSDAAHAELVRQAKADDLTITDLIKDALRLRSFVADRNASIVYTVDGKEREVFVLRGGPQVPPPTDR